MGSKDAPQEIYFAIDADGYEYPPDGFGMRGAKLDVYPGGRVTLNITRTNIAERLYRSTGFGIYRDSVMLGDKPPIADPMVDAKVVGLDSPFGAVYRGRIYWFWGDTIGTFYPLGHFGAAGATSALPGKAGGLDPSVGIDFSYFTDPKTGFSRPTCDISGDGPCWLGSLAVLPGAGGGASEPAAMLCSYAKMKSLGVANKVGIARWNDTAAVWQALSAYSDAASMATTWQAIQGAQVVAARGGSDAGDGYTYFATPYPLARIRASLPAAAWADLGSFEVWSCLEPNTTLADGKVDRSGPGGAARYTWRRFAAPVDDAAQASLIARGLLKPSEGWIQMRRADNSTRVAFARGTIEWNERLGEYVMIAQGSGQTTADGLGTIWFSRAPSVMGPWRRATRVVGHDFSGMTFYNPQHPAYFDAGSRIYFQATYVNSFSNAPPTPYANYNEVFYSLDVADPRLV